MAKPRIEGSFVATITPFNKDGSVDIAGFRTLLQFQERHGSVAVLIMGSTGEVSMLTPDERKMIMRETIKFKTGKMKFFYGCTGNNTATTIEYVNYAADQGADGAIIAAPSYICAPEDDIVDYFLEVADNVRIPIGIYNNPPRVKSDVPADGILRLAKHPNIIVSKESTARVGQVAQVARGNPDMSLMCCDSPNLGLVIPTMALGGHGTANMTGNVLPEELAVISRPWKTFDDAIACREAWLKNLPMLHFTYSAINPVALKSLMRVIGMPAGDMRRPLKLLSDDKVQKGIDILRELGVAEKYGYKLPGTVRRAAAE